MLTPLPNLTVYYTGYRIYSHFRALQGAKALDHGLAQLNSRQLRELRDQVRWGGVGWGGVGWGGVGWGDTGCAGRRRLCGTSAVVVSCPW